MRFGSALVISAAVLFAAGPALAYDQLVEKQSFTIPEFTTQGGATIRDMRLGWEAYGTLNAAKDNVILVAHYFSGSSHAAGKYAAEDKAAGYWDAIIGAARAKVSDANHFLYLVKANQLFYAGHGETLYEGLLKIEAPVLIIHSDEDQVFPGNAVRETAAIIKSDGTAVQMVELEGTRGHLDGVLSIAQAGPQIAAFLND